MNIECLYVKKISYLIGFHHEQFNILSQFILSLKYFITNLTFEKFQIFVTNQGLKWLPKTGWASSNVARHCRRTAARRRLLFCQKLGG
jgi:hypothetical protein